MDSAKVETQNATEDINRDAETKPPVAPSNGSTNKNPKPRLKKALLKQFITLSEAHDAEEDMRAELQYALKRTKFYTYFEQRLDQIRQLVAFHCGLNPDQVQVPEIFENNALVWLHGTFNMCIPLRIKNPGPSLPSKLAFRVPLPYRVGEDAYPGNSEEKLRSETATYIWIEKNCPDIPIPKLRGFGMPNGLSFCDPSFVPLWDRAKFYIRRFVNLLLKRQSDMSNFVLQKRNVVLEHGYMLIDWIEYDDVQMLSNTFQLPHTDLQTENLYRSMSKIMISLAKVPQPRIGSWTINNDGRISLTNRPMFCHLNILENWYIPTDIPRNMTYTSADSFYLDLLAGHDNRLQHQANAAFNDDDARGQAADILLMRALLHKFTDRRLRDGPFVMQLTDMHCSNILVDKDWNIKHVIDLEWACSLPLETLLPPFWLTEEAIDTLTGDKYEKFKTQYERFVEVFEEEEMRVNAPLQLNGTALLRAAPMKTSLNEARFFYLWALQSPKGLFNVSRQHLHSMFDKVSRGTLIDAISPFWTPGMACFVKSKLDKYNQYLQDVFDIFNSEKSGKAYYV
ncbi:predicted protein [Uncinocarpus reesii 1704]|uniref:Aminoglycoside phosphotransferase domain-containing protein n=1 Tax=Uncinocarpus reesii (strain UAMH 1704) TaxID=336963 RepID=C4K021_UNCRE|nr:uncharacterized protein UREG_07772 [Uncinocarpus reesii 1704]EEP82907.1 predicted protein [Uncinocarpus reesii 1704]